VGVARYTRTEEARHNMVRSLPWSVTTYPGWHSEAGSGWPLVTFPPPRSDALRAVFQALLFLEVLWGQQAERVKNSAPIKILEIRQQERGKGPNR